MTVRNATWNWARALTAAAVATVCLHVAPAAQDRLKSMPGYDQFQKMTKDTLSLAASLATPTITWSDDSSAFDYVRDGKLYRFDVAARQASVVGDAPQGRGRGGRGLVAGAAQGRGDAQPAPARGRQFDSEESPDKNRKAFYRDRNLWLVDADGSNEIALTTDGNDKDRIKYGTASWVYGEELNQRTAMWWSPDSRRLAYYRFDEKQVLDYYLQMTQTEIQDTLDVEAYPKPGRPNPIVDLFVYDVATKKTTKMEVRDGKPFADEVVGHYVYDVEWSPAGNDLFVNRTNRRQNVLEFARCAPDTGTCHAIVRDEWPTGWVDNSPQRTFLKDGRRFIWESERNGWKNFYLYDLSGNLLTPLTRASSYEVSTIVRIDEEGERLFYTARDGDNFLKLQLHSVGLDGRGDKRLTDPALNHTVTMSPDGKLFVDVAQTHDSPPTTRLCTADGAVVSEVAANTLVRFDQVGLKKVEMFTYLAADGRRRCTG